MNTATGMIASIMASLDSDLGKLMTNPFFLDYGKGATTKNYGSYNTPVYSVEVTRSGVSYSRVEGGKIIRTSPIKPWSNKSEMKAYKKSRRAARE